jgi:peptidoglycan/LPS O-acetylase OafA/YrhL
MASVGRNRTLDGIRGCLAVIVLARHAFQSQGIDALAFPAQFAVWTFFAMSGYVLTKSWDGRYFTFLLRRFVRLWPIYALCLGAGCALLGQTPAVREFFWIEEPGHTPAADSPAWSLIIEALAMPLMPVFVWIGRGSALRLGAGFLCTYLLALVYPTAIAATFFFAGAWLTWFEVRWPVFEGRLAQWLGRISYPLYLSHMAIVTMLGLPLPVSVPLAFAVAALLTETVEKWSIKASRAVRLPARRRVVAQEGFAL